MKGEGCDERREETEQTLQPKQICAQVEEQGTPPLHKEEKEGDEGADEAVAMSKSRLAPNMNEYQIEVLDYKHRKPPPNNQLFIHKDGRRVKEPTEHIPLITLFRHAKTQEQAKRSASKKGSVISCRKVDSHYRRLHMIEYLRLEPKPVVVDISPDEFLVGKDLTVSPIETTKKIKVEGGVDKRGGM
jgi:hypothetical protein